jgi:hypothetical protein
MPLNLSVGDGDFTPFLKYNAKAGRFYVRPDGATEDVEIVNPTLAFDMANIKTGWIFYAEGSGPEKIWDPSPTQMAPKPRDTRKFKRGFEVMVYGNTIIPRTSQKIGLREMSSTAANVIVAMVQMYSEYETGLASNPNCIPIFSCDGVKPINGAYGVNYEPQFVLKGWVPRSRVPAFDEHTSSAPPKTNESGHNELNPPDDFSETHFNRVASQRNEFTI